jgi:hypothetical protein
LTLPTTPRAARGPSRIEKEIVEQVRTVRGEAPMRSPGIAVPIRMTLTTAWPMTPKPAEAVTTASTSTPETADAPFQRVGPDASRPAVASIDLERITDEVLWKIERRALAHRERLGLG